MHFHIFLYQQQKSIMLILLQGFIGYLRDFKRPGSLFLDAANTTISLD